MNPGVQTPRNSYDPTRFMGGSSSGSATVVSAGLAPCGADADVLPIGFHLMGPYSDERLLNIACAVDPHLAKPGRRATDVAESL